MLRGRSSSSRKRSPSCFDGRRGQEGHQPLGHADRPGPGSAAAVGRREGLVQVEVHHVEAHVAGPRHPDQRVEVGAVVVQQRAGVVGEPRDLEDVLLEDAEGVGVGHHHRGDVLVEVGGEVGDVDGAVHVALDRHHLEAARRRRRRVGAVRAVGDEHAGALGVAAVRVVRLDHAQPGPLAVRAGGRLQRHPRHPGDRGEHPLQPPHQLERALHVRLVLVRVQVGEPGEAGELFVDDGVVLHGAAAQRVGAVVEVVVASRQAAHVAREHRFGHRGDLRRVRAQERAPGTSSSSGVGGTPAAVTRGPPV